MAKPNGERKTARPAFLALGYMVVAIWCAGVPYLIFTHEKEASIMALVVLGGAAVLTLGWLGMAVSRIIAAMLQEWWDDRMHGDRERWG